jgi:iron complex outermembrane receptor protein
MHVAFTLLLLAGGAPPDTQVVPYKEVVVTGTRMSESLQKVPSSITVVGRGAFADTRGISLKDALGGVPGVFVQSRSGGQDVRVTIRGFGARGNGERSNTGSMRGIRVLTDGIPVTEPDGRTSLDLVDLGSADRVEVSRSNASALYGNAAGGVVDLRTDLGFGRPYLEARERAGSFGYHREQGMAGFALGQTRGTFSLLNSDFDGWRRHSMSATTLAQGRMAVPLDDRTRLSLLVDATSNLNRYPGPLTQAQADSAPEQANARFVQRDERRKNKVGRAAVTLDRYLSDTHTLSLTTYVEPKVLQRSERNRFRDFNRYHMGGTALYEARMHFSEAVEAEIGGGLDGAWQDGSILFYDLGPNGTRGTNLIANKREGAGETGAFGQAELEWGGHWLARGAIRFDAVHYVSEDFIEPGLDARKTFRHWTPKAALSYHGGKHTVFAAVGGGVESPAFNEIDPPAPFDTATSLNPFLKPVRSTTYELGGRGSLGLREAGQLHYDAALYWIDVIDDIVPFNGGAYFFTAGKTRRKGIEAALGWLPTQRVKVEGILHVSQNEYREYENDLGNFEGNDVAGLPGTTFRSSIRYQDPIGLSAELGTESVGSYFADDANTAQVKGYTLLNATIGYTRTMSFGALRAFVAGNNLTDREYIGSAFINGVNGEFFEPGLPQNWSGGLTLRWH